MKTLFQAIYARYLATALGSSALTGLYHVQAPPRAVFPYGTFDLIANTPDWTFTEEFENCLLQFSLFSNVMSDSTQICDLFELLKTAFDKFDLVISGYTTISCVREPANLTKVEDVWQYTVTYRMYLEKD